MAEVSRGSQLAPPLVPILKFGSSPSKRRGTFETDRVRFVEHDARARGSQSLEFALHGPVIRLEVQRAAARDLAVAGLVTRLVKRLAIERGGGAQVCRGLPWIEGCAGRVAIYVDHRSRLRRSDRRGAQAGDEVIEQMDPPVRVLASQP